MIETIAMILINPFFWVVFLLALTLFLRKRHRVRLAIVAALVILFLFSNPFLHRVVTHWWEPGAVSAEEVEAAEPWEIGIVLGGFTRMHGRPLDRLHLNDAANRFSQAVELYHRGKIEALVFVSGSRTSGDSPVSEADLARDAAIRLGVPEDDVIALGTSRNTFENAVEVREFLEARTKPKSMLLVTSASHVRRAIACFAKQGLTPDTFPTDHRSNRDPEHRDTFGSLFMPSPATFTAWSGLFREWLAMATYRVRGRI